MRDGYLAVLGGNKMACHGIERLEALGYRLLVLDGNPQAAARTPGRPFLAVDFSDTNAALRALEPFELGGIMPLNDFAVRSSSRIARERGLRGWTEETAYRLTNKAAMRAVWREANLPQPSYCSVSIEDLLAGQHPVWDSFPCIVKPAFAGGASRGVHLVHDWDEARAVVEATRDVYLDADVVIEEYVRGTEHTLEVVVRDGRPTLLSISDKQNYPGHVSVVQNLYFPGPVGWAAQDRLRDLVFAACGALGVTDGACHFEVLLTEHGPVLLEVGGRPGGGLNFDPICRISTGYDYPSLLACILTGESPRFVRQEPCHLAWHYFDGGDGTVQDIIGMDEVDGADGVVDVECYERVGEPRRRLTDDLERPGYVLVRADSHGAARTLAARVCDRIEVLTHAPTSKSLHTEHLATASHEDTGWYTRDMPAGV
ncbi:MAG: ATP-grasp domain-containing protein [Rhodothermales bacterium]